MPREHSDRQGLPSRSGEFQPEPLTDPVLSASRLQPLVPFPLASPARTREDQNGIRRCLTIELHPRGLLVQCRGFANRWPMDEEATVIQRWANEHDLLYIDPPL
jgi:hypothetical protein